MSQNASGRVGFADASIIVRYLTGDVSELVERARDILDGHPDMHITEGTILEVAFVLTRVYQVPRATVVDNLIALIQKANIRVHQLNKQTVVEALLLCRPPGRVSFGDGML